MEAFSWTFLLDFLYTSYLYHIMSSSAFTSNSEQGSSAQQHPPNWAPILEQAIYTRRQLRIVCIGAGLSGLTLAHKIKHEFKATNVDFTIYDRNHDVGGTWLENTYPGAAW
jgi:hypothetical protein